MSHPAVQVLRRVGSKLAYVLAYALLAVLSTVLGLLLHLDLPACKRAVRDIINQTLRPSFRGTVRIDHIGHLRLAAVQDVSVTVLDPQGKKVLYLQGVGAKVAVDKLVRSLFESKKPLELILEKAHIDWVDATLAEQPDGKLTLQAAFESPQPPKPPEPEGRGMVLATSGFVLKHLWVHGGLKAYPTIDAELNQFKADLAVHPKVTAARVYPFEVIARALPVQDVTAKIEATFLTPSPSGQSMLATAKATLASGKVPLSLSGWMDGDNLGALIDLPRTQPKAFSALMPEPPIHAPADVHIEVTGTLPEVRVQGRIGIGPGRIDIKAKAQIQKQLAAWASVELSDIQPQSFSPTAPAGGLSGHLEANAQTVGDALKGSYTLQTVPTSLAAQAVPAVQATGSFTKEVVAGRIDIEEPGAPTEIHFSLQPSQPNPAIRLLAVDVHTAAPSLGDIRRIQMPISGSARLDASAQVLLQQPPRIQAQAFVRIANVRQGERHMREATLRANAQGTPEDLAFSAQLAANQIALGDITLSKVQVLANGPVKRPAIYVQAQSTDGDRVDMHTMLALEKGISVLRPVVRLARKGQKATVSADAIAVQGKTFQAQGVRVEGLGSPITAEVKSSPGGLHVQAKAEQIDLRRVALIAGKTPQDASGFVSLDTDIKTRGASLEGHMKASLWDAAFGKLGQTKADLDATFAGQTAGLHLEAQMGQAARISLQTSEMRLEQRALAPEAWKKALGQIKAEVHLDLKRLQESLPKGSYPFGSSSGTVDVVATLDRAVPEYPPTLTLSAQTQAIDIVMLPATADPTRPVQVTTGQPQPLHIKDIDLKAQARLDGATGNLELDSSVLSKGEQKILLQAKSPLPWKEFWAAPSQASARLMTTPFEAKLTIPPQRMQDLPQLIRPATFQGQIQGELTAQGTALDPTISLKAQLKQLVAKSILEGKHPMDLSAQANFADSKGKLGVQLSDQKGPMVTADSDFTMNISDLVHPPKNGPRWDASAKINLDAFPLQVLSALTDRPLYGCVFGAVELQGLHKDAQLHGELRVEQMRLGPVPFRGAKATLKAQGGQLLVDTVLEQQDGRLAMRAEGGINWGAELAPTLDPAKPITAELKASSFHLRALRPFVRQTLGDIDGRFDANLRVRASTQGTPKAQIQGSLALRDAMVDSPLIGQPLQHIELQVIASEDGRIRMEKLSVQGLSGILMGAGELRWDGQTVRSAAARLVIPKDDAFPVTTQGVNLGDAWGRVEVKAIRATEQGPLDVQVQVPELEFTLTPSASHSVQPLKDDPTIQIGAQYPQGTFASLPLRKPTEPKSNPAELAGAAPPEKSTSAKPPAEQQIRLSVQLGDKVRLRRMNQLDAYVTGQANVVSGAGPSQVSGHFEVARGYVEVQGRRFNIERATVAINPDDPSNPVVSASAVYDAPENVRVTADFLGTPEAGKLTLRSDPPLTQSEILSLIAFGSSEGLGAPSRPGQSQQSQAAQAAGLAGGTITTGLNEALSDISPVEIQTRVNTTESSNPRPEIAVMLTDQVTAQVSYNMGLPTPGQNPDRTMLTIDYRFRPRWSVTTSLGDRGTSILDFIWRYRY